MSESVAVVTKFRTESPATFLVFQITKKYRARSDVFIAQ